MESLAYQIAFYTYALATLMTLLLGLVYATRKQVMPYHLAALETTWDAIDAKYQLILRVFLNGAGFSALSVGLFMLILLWIPFSAKEIWAGYLIGVAGLVSALPLGFIVYTVKHKTNGNPPFGLVVLLNCLLLIGLLATIWYGNFR